MSGMEKLDIKKLTRDAESGNGCALKDALNDLFYEERLGALKAIAKQNKENRSSGDDVPRLRAHGYHEGMDMHYDKNIVNFNRVILFDSMDMSTGTHKFTCQDLSKK